MYNANHFIHCNNCGAEFRSSFAGAAIVRGCTELCPHCHKPVATPLFLDDENAESLQRAANEPMYRHYGEGGNDGSVFLGRGRLTFTIQSSLLIPVLASYQRNINRVLDLLDIFYRNPKENAQVLLSTIYILTMTAYECHTDDLLIVLQKHQLAQELTGKTTLSMRRDHLFKTLQFTADDHVTALKYLYAFRNCLIHNAGVVDEEFRKNIQKIGSVPPQLSVYQVGQPLILETSTAISFADALQKIVHSLLPLAQTLCDK